MKKSVLLVVLSLVITLTAYAETITLSPDPLNLETNTSGNLTVTLSTPAPVGGLTFAVAVAPGLSVSVPLMVTVPADQTFVQIQVIAGSEPGTEQVSVIGSFGFVGDSVTVNVESPVLETTCNKATQDAAHAARAYVKAVRTVGRICTKIQSECMMAVSQADSALNTVVLSHDIIAAACQ